MTYGQNFNYPPMTPPPAKKHTARNVVLGIVFGILLLCLIGGIASLANGGNDKAAPLVNAKTFEPPATPAAKSSSAPKPVKTVNPKPAPVTIGGDDIVHVGEDIPAGTYRAATSVEPGSLCYWKKSSDAEGDNIIDNDIPTGGRPQVTLKSGQWFSTSNCPTWVKK
jgi:hypothetical protein